MLRPAMKFGTFHIRQLHESERDDRAYHQELEQIEYAEELGFDAVWLAEHHFSRYSIIPDPMVMLANMAQRTRRVRIGVAVEVLPLHNPIRLAEQIATVDILSGGRLDVGLGRGYQKGEFESLGQDLMHSRERFKEAYELLQLAWKPGQFSYTGKHFTVPPMEVYPKPLQKPHPPLWIASSGTPETMDWIAGQRLPFIRGPYLRTADIPGQLDRYVTVRHEAGHAEADIQRDLANCVVSRKVYVAPTEQEARETIFEPLWWVNTIQAKVTLPTQSKDDLNLVPYNYQRAQRLKLSQASFEELWEREVLGDVDRCVKLVQDMVDAGVQYFLFLFSFGGLEHKKVLQSMKTFATEVLPQVKAAQAAKAKAR